MCWRPIRSLERHYNTLCARPLHLTSVIADLVNFVLCKEPKLETDSEILPMKLEAVLSLKGYISSFKAIKWATSFVDRGELCM